MSLHEVLIEVSLNELLDYFFEFVLAVDFGGACLEVDALPELTEATCVSHI